MANHDGTYHSLFSFPEMVAELLIKYVNESWVKTLDFNTLQRENIKEHHRNYPNEEIIRREGDLLWRVKDKRGDEHFILIMLELQSKVDPWMAVRFLAYVALLYQNLIKEKRLSRRGKLPPIFPLVLYNGSAPWTASTELRELIDLDDKAPLWLYQPALVYNVIDEKDYLPDSEGEGTLTELLFGLEHSRSPEELLKYIKALSHLFSREKASRLSQAVLDWLRSSEPVKRLDLPAATLSNFGGDDTMLAEQVDKWEKDLLTRGREEGIMVGREEGITVGREEGITVGREEGITVGREEGKYLAMCEILRGQIVQKFGQSAWERSQFQVQSLRQSEQLQQACERLLVVNSVEELFED